MKASMTVEHKDNGATVITDIKNGYLFKRVYFGYTDEEAIACFDHDYRTSSK